MSDFFLFVCGVIVTLITGIGVITSQVFCGYARFIEDSKPKENRAATENI